MPRRTLQRIALIAIPVVGLSGWIPNVAEAAPIRETTGFTFTHKAPPQWTSAAGGVRVRMSPPGPQRVFRIVRYDAAMPPAIVDTATVEPRGHVVKAYIDSSGTVVVIAGRPRALFSLVWEQGKQPGSWTQLTQPSDRMITAVVSTWIDDRGDIVVGGRDVRLLDYNYLVYDPVDGWSALQEVSLNDSAGHVGGFQVSPDGRLVALASEGSTPTVTVTELRKPLLAAHWTSRRVLAGPGSIGLIREDAGPDGSAALSIERAHSSTLEVVGTATSATYALPQGFDTVCERSDGAEGARYIAFDGTTFTFISYDGQWSASSVDSPVDSDSWPRCTISPGGDIVMAWGRSYFAPVKKFVEWRSGEPAGPIEILTTNRHLRIGQVAALSSGEVWVRFGNVLTHRTVYAVKPAP